MSLLKLKGVRASMVQLTEKKAYQPGSKEVYSVQWLIPRDDPQIPMIIKAYNETLKEGKEKFGNNWGYPDYELGFDYGSDFKMGLKDGDITNTKRVKKGKKVVESLKGMWYLSSNSQFEIKIVGIGRDKNGAIEILPPSAIWPGMLCNLVGKLSPYDGGISCYIQAIQATGKGERLDNVVDPEKEFDFEDFTEADISEVIDEPVKF
jgi:hypothetical protein